ncbi:hypothetical protein HQQ81_21020 [Microbacteriaceae bacterium VKM Ac-2854]|nr:hypothetical protein [Microbacteriaceae bacterium VKM Ac-2854]
MSSITPFGGASRARGYREDTPSTPTRLRPAERPAEPALIDADTLPDDQPSPPVEPAALESADTSLEEEESWDLSAPDLSVPIEENPAVASEGMRGFVVKATGGLIKLAPGAAELAHLELTRQFVDDERIIRQATWRRAVSVLVANRKGGTGKTPTALCLGGILAAVRGGSVAIMEVSDDPGALTYRAEGSPTLGLGELIRDLEHITSAGQLAGYTAPQTSFASVIGTVGHRGRLTRDNVVSVAAVVDEFYGIRVMDSGNQPTSDAFAGAVESADVLVVPLLNAGDAAMEALALLDELDRAGGHAAELAKNAIVVRLTDGRPESPKVVERIDRLLQRRKPAGIYTIPFDTHIAERAQITLDQLAPDTRREFTHVAAGVVTVLQTTVR